MKECPTNGAKPECKITSRITAAGTSYDGCTFQLKADYFTAFMDETTKKAYIDKFYPGGYEAYE